MGIIHMTCAAERGTISFIIKQFYSVQYIVVDLDPGLAVITLRCKANRTYFHIQPLFCVRRQDYCGAFSSLRILLRFY